jgi:hypothetical protein
MDAPVDKPRYAWQPLTPRGVAAFAHARAGCLPAVQFVVAALAAATVVWFLHGDWFPIISQAINRLPADGQIRGARVDWQGDASPVLLAENRFLAITVDLKHEGAVRSPAHIQAEFGRDQLQIISLFGFLPVNYPAQRTFAFNRPALIPWWGAWAPEILGLAAAGTIAALMICWAVLATLYCLPVWLVGLFANRELNLGGSWRLAGAALMPGALFLLASILLYGWGALDPIHLLVAMGVHFVIGWIYCLAAPFALPLHPAVSNLKANPFKTPANGTAPPSTTPSTSPES